MKIGWNSNQYTSRWVENIKVSLKNSKAFTRARSRNLRFASQRSSLLSYVATLLTWSGTKSFTKVLGT